MQLYQYTAGPTMHCNENTANGVVVFFPLKYFYIHLNITHFGFSGTAEIIRGIWKFSGEAVRMQEPQTETDVQAHVHR